MLILLLQLFCLYLKFAIVTRKHSTQVVMRNPLQALLCVTAVVTTVHLLGAATQGTFVAYGLTCTIFGY